MRTVKEIDYNLSFANLLQHDPSNEDFAEWNRRHMSDCIRRGDAVNAGVYATELVRWSLS